uniref:Centromere protein H n=1 Tax=Cyanoderma ruficeps TaxID=181631 RepID=A0A8C3XBK1_9PASS
MAALALEPPAPAPTFEPPAPPLDPEPIPAPVPAPVWVQGSINDGDLNALALLRLRDRLKEQLVEYKAALLANQEYFTNHLKINIIEEKLIQSATKNLQKSIEEVKVSLQNKTLALQRVQITDALRNQVDHNDEDSRLILETMKQIGLLSQAVVEYQQQANHKEERMTDIKRKRLCLKVDEGQKVEQIQTTMDMQEEKPASVNVSETENNKLEQEKQMTAVIQNVFQNLIVGSGVNWAEDASLKAVVLRLENNVCVH